MAHALNDAAEKKRLMDNAGAVPLPLSPDNFGSFVAGDAARWKKVIATAGITPE